MTWSLWHSAPASSNTTTTAPSNVTTSHSGNSTYSCSTWECALLQSYFDSIPACGSTCLSVSYDFTYGAPSKVCDLDVYNLQSQFVSFNASFYACISTTCASNSLDYSKCDQIEQLTAAACNNNTWVPPHAPSPPPAVPSNGVAPPPVTYAQPSYVNTWAAPTQVYYPSAASSIIGSGLVAAGAMVAAML